MKSKLNIFSNKSIRNFLGNFLLKYDLFLMDLEDIENSLHPQGANIIIINDNKEVSLVNFKNLNSTYLVISCIKNNNLFFNKAIQLLRCPLSIINFENSIENFIQNLQFDFHDLSIDNEKLINLKNNLFCYLTKAELDILIHLIREKETSKNFIKEYILNIKSNMETNSLESHLTRIRRKMSKINTKVKIKTKNEKLIITV